VRIFENIEATSETKTKNLTRGRRGEADPVNVQQGLSFLSTYSPQRHIALGYTILNNERSVF